MNKMGIKGRITLLAAAALTAALAVGSTTAYFTAKGRARNVITTGSIDISIEEKMTDADGQTVPFESAVNVMPGESVSKIVQIRNEGTEDAWIRVSVDKSFDLSDTDGDGSSLIQLNVNEECWTEQNGFYYYNAVLHGGELTEPLFTTVTFSKNMGNRYQKTKAFVDVTAYGVQTVHNGESVLEAAGWPAENEKSEEGGDTE